MITIIPEAAMENLRFLTAEVESQVTYLQRYLAKPNAAASRRILDRAGYASNLKMRVHNSCLTRLSRGRVKSQQQLALTGFCYVATHLERVTDKCRDAVDQLALMEDLDNLDAGGCRTMLGQVLKGVRLVPPAVENNDTGAAVKVGEIEERLERRYNRLKNSHIDSLRKRRQLGDLSHALLVAYSIKQMGDSLLRASESIISLNLGQPITFERYQSLQELAGSYRDEDLHIETIAETRSGSTIAGVITARQTTPGYVAIYKDGQKGKLKEERQGVESWHEIYPGLAPRILSYRKRGESAALLIEHLSGLTFEQILLRESPELIAESLKQLGKTLRSVWKATRTDKPVSAGFIQQMQSRMGGVYRVHPKFKQSDSRICDLAVPSFDTLIKQAARYERKVRAPFSVYIHGDFNVDNIIYDPLERRINFIDLHRSRHMDYVQDVSVFMVSIYRLRILDAPARRGMMGVILDFYAMARRFARKRDDETFELRLALGLARSFATSTRFILDEALSRRMFLRSRYLMELVLQTDPAEQAGFRLPMKEIFVD